MSIIYRVCPECGEQSPLETKHCSHCGFDHEGGVPAVQKNLPVAIGKAALPILAGALSLAARAGWRLLQNRLEQSAQQALAPRTNASVATTPDANSTPIPSAPSAPRKTIHIRSSWAVGDATGAWQRGSSEHTIEIHE